MIMELGPYKKREIELPPLFGHQMMVENGSAWNGMGNVIFDFHTYLIGGAPI